MFSGLKKLIKMLSKKEKNKNTFMPGAAHVKPLDMNPDAWTPLMAVSYTHLRAHET